MGGRLADVDSAVDMTLAGTLVCGMAQWVNNTAAGNITITAPANCSFSGGGTTLVMPTGTHGCFVNVGGAYIHARVFSV
jgi:hypothetical protein